MVVYSDHRSLEEMHFKKVTGRWSRWLADIMEIGAIIKNISGSRNVVADAMTRLHKLNVEISSIKNSLARQPVVVCGLTRN